MMQGRAFNMIKSIGKKLESFFFSLNFDWQAMMQSASYLTAPPPFSYRINLPDNKARTMLNLDKVKKRHQVKTGHNTKQKLMFKTKFKQYICATTISSVLRKKSFFCWTLFVLI